MTLALISFASIQIFNWHKLWKKNVFTRNVYKSNVKFLFSVIFISRTLIWIAKTQWINLSFSDISDIYINSFTHHLMINFIRIDHLNLKKFLSIFAIQLLSAKNFRVLFIKNVHSINSNVWPSPVARRGNTRVHKHVHSLGRPFTG